MIICDHIHKAFVIIMLKCATCYPAKNFALYERANWMYGEGRLFWKGYYLPVYCGCTPQPSSPPPFQSNSCQFGDRFSRILYQPLRFLVHRFAPRVLKSMVNPGCFRSTLTRLGMCISMSVLSCNTSMFLVYSMQI